MEAKNCTFVSDDLFRRLARFCFCRSGRGSLKVRARWKIEDLARGQWQIVVTELPPGTSAQKVLEEIEELTNPKVKTGKKALTAEQRADEEVLLGVRLREGLPTDRLEPQGRRAVAGLVADGLVDGRSAVRGRVVLTRRGRLLADTVVGQLLAEEAL